MNDTLIEEITQEKPRTAALNLKFISHGTLESKNHEETRKFYEEFMGFEVVRASDLSVYVRLGGMHSYVVVPKDKNGPPMSIRNHNGVDVHSDAEVDAAYETAVRDAEKWGLYKISKPRVQHGTYSFYFWDRDDNSWEILSNPPGGYDWMFKRGDQEGKGSTDTKYARPVQDR